jgi:hypothetical protein
VPEHPDRPHLWVIETPRRGRDPNNLLGQCKDCGEIKGGFVGTFPDSGGWPVRKKDGKKGSYLAT